MKLWEKLGFQEKQDIIKEIKQGNLTSCQKYEIIEDITHLEEAMRNIEMTINPQYFDPDLVRIFELIKIKIEKLKGGKN